jgi:hypothetical protein
VDDCVVVDVDEDELAADDIDCCELYQSKQASIISLASGDQNDYVWINRPNN